MTAPQDLLAPIPGPRRTGTDLRYSPLYDQIREARREDDDAPQGEWQRARKVADWGLVVRLSRGALASQSKDLQIAAWLTEALLRRDGVRGLREGLTIVRSLLEEYWDDLYPDLEDGEAELRAAPLEWIGLKLEIPVRQVPLDKSGHDLFAYRTSRAVGYESDTGGDPEKEAARARAIGEGKLTAEEFDRAFESTPKAWYRAFVTEIDAALEAVRDLDAVSSARFGDIAPSYLKLVEALEEIRHVAGQLLRRKLELDPDPDPMSDVAVPTSAVRDDVLVGTASGTSSAMGGTAPTAEPASRAHAAALIAGAARFLRREHPRDPAAYLLLRGYRWGELRANGSSPDPRLLEAPPTQVRSQLKGLLLDSRWDELLESCEQVMATPHGRGWLDLQRYTLTACAGLGADFDHVAMAISGELRTLLSEIPQLADMMLMDDTPTANAETRAWLRDAILTGSGDASEARDLLRDAAAAAPVRASGDAVREGIMQQALVEVRAGRPEKAIQTLVRELERERTPRGRFLRQVQIAEIMMEAGLDTIARPILQELVDAIDRHKLDEWEAGEVIARPLALLYRCLSRTDGSAESTETLYLRICRLDPVQAIGFTQA